MRCLPAVHVVVDILASEVSVLKEPCRQREVIRLWADCWNPSDKVVVCKVRGLENSFCPTNPMSSVHAVNHTLASDGDAQDILRCRGREALALVADMDMQAAQVVDHHASVVTFSRAALWSIEGSLQCIEDSPNPLLIGDRMRVRSVIADTCQDRSICVQNLEVNSTAYHS